MLKFTSFFTRFICLIVGLAMLIGAPGPVKNGAAVPRDETVLFEVNVVSDIHMEGNNDYRKNLYVQALRNMKEYTRADALIMCGDNTMNGHTGEYWILNGVTDRVLPDTLVLPAVGNHDVGNGEGDLAELSARFISQYNAFHTDDPINSLYYSREFEGCVFVALANDTDNDDETEISVAQTEWFSAILDRADAEGKPVLVACHFPYYYFDTDLREIMAAHRNVYYFSGHIHRFGLSVSHMGTDRDDLWYFNLPRVTEYNESNDTPYSITGLGLNLQITRTTVTVNTYNFYTAQLLDSVTVPILK